MSENSCLQVASALLRTAYGSVDLPMGDTTWSLFLRVLFSVPAEHAAHPALTDLLRSAPLANPREAAAATAGQLVEILGPIPRGAQKASVVRAVAAWWLTHFGDETSPEWTSGVAVYRESLRQIRGLGPATVDELLLFAAQLPVFPVDRSALRVAIRHGWLNLPVDDEQAQSFFIQGMKQSGLDAREFSRLLTKVGEAHCGREPRCEGCPLQSQLPSGGPLNPESC
jgi:endonuclease-3 related protein